MLFVNKIYLRYKNQEISKEEAVSYLLAEIFKSPRYYCMEQLPEDEISNFLLENDMLIYLVIFDKSAFQISEKLFSDITQYINDNYVDDMNVR